MTFTDASPRATSARPAHGISADPAIEELLCDTAAAGDREGVLSLLSGHLAALTGAGRVHLAETAAGVTEILASDIAGSGRVELVRTPALTAVLHGSAGPTGSQRKLAERALRWGAAALRLLDVAGDARRETAALHDAAAYILRVRDPEQVLLSINECSLGLLQADICGVFLREGDELVMRGCVGNRSVETSRLRMRRGQGLAGQVFSTGIPGRVANYQTDRSISQDFMSLAATEQTLSALAAPMRAQGQLIGVLEVWRRRPSVFTADDTRRLEALANLATIAIDNARLHSAHEQSVADLRAAHQELATKLITLGRSAAVQRSLLDTVLTGSGHAGIVAALFGELGWPAVVLGPGSQPIARCPQRVDTGPLRDLLRSHSGHTGEQPIPGDGGEPPRIARAHPIVLDGEVHGHVCLIAHAVDRDLLDSALSQAAMACCLVELQQQTASRARAQACDEVLWDLLDGPVEQREAARSRATSMGVRLSRSMRVVQASLDNVADVARLPQQDTEGLDRIRRQVLRCIREHAPPAQLTLAAQRGDWIIGLSGLADAEETRSLLESLSAAVARRWPDLRVQWAASGAGHDALGLPQALNEARAAMDAARRLVLAGPCLYDELGVVRLLVGGQEDPDLRKFVCDITQPLLDYDASHDGALIATLRAFFQADCSQRVAAQRLFIHHKTLRYRLEQIRALTGLDLSRHADRVRADLALQLLEVTRTAGLAQHEQAGLRARLAG